MLVSRGSALAVKGTRDNRCCPTLRVEELSPSLEDSMQAQEASRTPHRCDLKRTSPWCIIVKTLQLKTTLRACPEGKSRQIVQHTALIQDNAVAYPPVKMTILSKVVLLTD